VSPTPNWQVEEQREARKKEWAAISASDETYYKVKVSRNEPGAFRDNRAEGLGTTLKSDADAENPADAFDIVAKNLRSGDAYRTDWTRKLPTTVNKLSS
jgi:hypothetical protein